MGIMDYSKMDTTNKLMFIVFSTFCTLSPYQFRILVFLYDNNNIPLAPNYIFNKGRLTHDLFYRVIVKKEIKALLTRKLIIETCNKSGKFKYYQLTDSSIELISCLKKAVQT